MPPAASSARSMPAIEVAVVVSAMAGATNQLVDWTRQVNPLHDAREYDAVVASGEQVTAGLMALALQTLGVNARSWLGWQVPIRTDGVHGKARIEAIDTAEIERGFAEGQVAVVAGFQGLGTVRTRHDPGPRRLRHLGGGARGGAEGRSLRYLHRCGRRLHDRPAHRCKGAQAG